MQRQIFHSVTVVVLMFSSFTASVGSAQEWNWNPLSKSAWSRDASPLYTNIASSEKTSWLPKWQSPKMPWSKSPPVRSYPKPKTSTWNQINNTSKRWWNKTLELLDPYPEPKLPKYNPPSGKKPKSNWFGGMFQPKEPPNPKTVTEFLGQDIPK
jgi:hypothetical protein